MIIHVPNVFRDETIVRHDYAGPIIDFLQKKWPEGFPGGVGRIYVNQEEVNVDDYDIEIGEDDTCVIITGEPRDPVTAAFVAYAAGTATAAQFVFVTVAINLALALASAAITSIFAKKPSQRRAARQVYEIGSAQNQPALGEVITEHFGSLWFYPDVASQPYTFFQNNEQYIHQLLLVGAGQYQIDDIRFGSTDFAQIPSGLVEYQVFGPSDHKSQYGQIQSLFGINEDVISVPEVQSIELSRNAQTSFFGAAYSSDKELRGKEPPTGFNVGDVVTLLGDKVTSVNNHRIDRTITAISGNKIVLNALANDAANPWYQAVKDDDGWRGWFEALPAGKTTDRLDFDFVFAYGLYKTDSDGDFRRRYCFIDVEVQQIDDLGNNIGPVITRSYTYFAATNDPIRKSESIAVPAGRFKARVRRNDRDDAKSNEMSRVSWVGFKAYAINTIGQFVYGDVTIIGVKMKASNALSNTSDRISVKATRKLPTLSSDLATIEPTVNVADAFAYIVQQADPDGADIPALKALATKWDGTNGFNFRFSDSSTVYDALQTVASSHRAQPEAYARKLTMRPDVAKPFDQYIVSHESMLKGSYSCGISLASDAGVIDGYRVAYTDPNGVRELYVVFPTGASAPEAITALGCTDAATALAQGQYLWAKRIATKRVLEFRTEWGGNIFSIGDRISVLQNLVDTVRTARVMDYSGSVLTVDATLQAPQVVVRLSDQYGQPSEPIEASMNGNQLTLASPAPFPIFGINSGQDPTPVVIGGLQSFQKSYLITSISPGDDGVTVSAITYTNEPYLYPIPGAIE